MSWMDVLKAAILIFWVCFCVGITIDFIKNP